MSETTTADQLMVSCSPVGTQPRMESGANRQPRHLLTRQGALLCHNVPSCSFLQQNHRKSLFSTKYGLVSPGRCDAGRCPALFPGCLAARMTAMGVITHLVSQGWLRLQPKKRCFCLLRWSPDPTLVCDMLSARYSHVTHDHKSNKKTNGEAGLEGITCLLLLSGTGDCC